MLLVGALAIALIVRDRPALLEQNGNLSPIQNFVITPVSPAGEPAVQVASESLVSAIVQSSANQSDESSSSDMAPSEEETATTPTLAQPEGESNAAATVSKGQAAPQDTAIPPVETATESAISPTETVTANEEEPTPTQTPTPFRYKMKDGDTIIGIAERYKIPYKDVLAANGLTERAAPDLRAGKIIVLPGVVATAPLAATPSGTPTTTQPTPSPSPQPTATPGA